MKHEGNLIHVEVRDHFDLVFPDGRRLKVECTVDDVVITDVDGTVIYAEWLNK